ncbi:MAG: hypothetical protein IKJ94_00760 [Oscillospiraceae bacterium]|nr:hypothetical protein [Oscillospiraceae bacterium]
MKTVGITHFLLKSYNPTRAKAQKHPQGRRPVTQHGANLCLFQAMLRYGTSPKGCFCCIRERTGFVFHGGYFDKKCFSKPYFVDLSDVVHYNKSTKHNGNNVCECDKKTGAKR